MVEFRDTNNIYHQFMVKRTGPEEQYRYGSNIAVAYNPQQPTEKPLLLSQIRRPVYPVPALILGVLLLLAAAGGFVLKLKQNR